ncbi:hypothetical protein BOTNAR_0691g00040 [Botryotinia narcissicola]|uniref:Uncharacterized protein n=1 Tax=Botryotinia narcissicola TaxID=278944 RepID=A0A4Z1H8K6_9HELO|nr:hypothetical protein BOTNAR_0691g00040 [Botryotinia narcissicola]
MTMIGHATADYCIKDFCGNTSDIWFQEAGNGGNYTNARGIPAYNTSEGGCLKALNVFQSGHALMCIDAHGTISGKN